MNNNIMDQVRRFINMFNRFPDPMYAHRVWDLIWTIDQFRAFKKHKDNEDRAFEIIDELCESQELIDRVKECEHDIDQQRLVRIAVLDKLKGL